MIDLRVAGDVDGHPFYGNQYTGGGGGEPTQFERDVVRPAKDEKRLDMPIKDGVKGDKRPGFGNCTQNALEVQTKSGGDVYVGTVVRQDRYDEAKRMYDKDGTRIGPESIPHAWNVQDGKVVDTTLGSSLARERIYFGVKVPTSALEGIKNGDDLAKWHAGHLRSVSDRLTSAQLAVTLIAAARAAGTLKYLGDYDGHPFRGNQYTDAAGADEWGGKTQKWAKDLTPIQENALHAYTMSVRVNDTLRTGRTPGDHLVWDGNGVQLTEIQQIRGLDEIFAKSETILKEPLVVHRAWSNPEQIADIPAGATFVDKGFTSTSLVKAETKVFGQRGSAQVEIRVPAGQRALYLGKVAAGAKWYASSAELLLNRNTQYKVISNEKKGIGKRRMVLEVLP